MVEDTCIQRKNVKCEIGGPGAVGGREADAPRKGVRAPSRFTRAPLSSSTNEETGAGRAAGQKQDCSDLLAPFRSRVTPADICFFFGFG